MRLLKTLFCNFFLHVINTIIFWYGHVHTSFQENVCTYVFLEYIYGHIYVYTMYVQYNLGHVHYPDCVI